MQDRERERESIANALLTAMPKIFRLEEKTLSAVKQRGREKKGPPDIAPKSCSQKGALFFHRSHREICTRNRPLSETKFLDDFLGPLPLLAPFVLLLTWRVPGPWMHSACTSICQQASVVWSRTRSIRQTIRVSFSSEPPRSPPFCDISSGCVPGPSKTLHTQNNSRGINLRSLHTSRVVHSASKIALGNPFSVCK